MATEEKEKKMSIIKKIWYVVILVMGILSFSTGAGAVEYSPGLRIKTISTGTGSGCNQIMATLYLPGNADIKGVAETGAAYNYLGLELPDGKSVEIGLTKDKYDLEESRWSVFAYANYEGAFAHYGTEERWVNFRWDGAEFTGPHVLVPDGSTVDISLKVLKEDEVVFEVSGYELLSIKMPGAHPQGENQVFRLVTSLMTDDPEGFFKNTSWSDLKVKKGPGPFTPWEPRDQEVWMSNNMNENDPFFSWVSVSQENNKDNSEDNNQAETVDITMDGLSEENRDYALEIRKKSETTMRVQFLGNEMYHNDKQLGFGVRGRPMLSLRYLAEWFGFGVEYDPEMGTALVSKGTYGFRLKPGSDRAEISWAGEKVSERELTDKPLLQDNVFYLYSLDLSDLLGLIAIWDDRARTWDIIFRDYTVRELGFPTTINDDVLTLKVLLYDTGTFTMPFLGLKDRTTGLPSQVGSTSFLESGPGSLKKYEVSSTIKVREKTRQLQVSLKMGERIIYAKDFAVRVNIEEKELVVEPPYQLSNPQKGFVRVDQPWVLVRGAVAGEHQVYPEIVFFVKTADREDILQEEVLRKETVAIVEGQFEHVLELEKEEGLYKVTVNSIMAGPRGPVYPEITNFYVEYRKGDKQDS
jgi:hypothetical protein